MDLKIHHFYDIIRDFGRGKEILPHPYGHSYHQIARMIRDNPGIQIRLVIGPDDICEGCEMLQEGRCIDSISHRRDFLSKEDFNDHIDRKIMKVLSLGEGDTLTPQELCLFAKSYLANIEWIYEGNDPEHTAERKKNVIAGFRYYSKLHGF